MWRYDEIDSVEPPTLLHFYIGRTSDMVWTTSQFILDSAGPHPCQYGLKKYGILRMV